MGDRGGGRGGQKTKRTKRNQNKKTIGEKRTGDHCVTLCACGQCTNCASKDWSLLANKQNGKTALKRIHTYHLSLLADGEMFGEKRDPPGRFVLPTGGARFGLVPGLL